MSPCDVGCIVAASKSSSDIRSQASQRRGGQDGGHVSAVSCPSAMATANHFVSSLCFCVAFVINFECVSSAALCGEPLVYRKASLAVSLRTFSIGNVINSILCTSVRHLR